jgi:hypothetical protein
VRVCVSVCVCVCVCVAARSECLLREEEEVPPDTDMCAVYIRVTYCLCIGCFYSCAVHLMARA